MITLVDVVNIVRQNLLDFERERQEIESQMDDLEELLEECRDAAAENFSLLAVTESLVAEIDGIASDFEGEVEEMMAFLNNLEAKIDYFFQEIQLIGKQRKEETTNLIQKMAATTDFINSHLQGLQEAMTDLNDTVEEVKPSLENHLNNLTQLLADTLLPAIENCREEVEKSREELEEICEGRILNFLDSQQEETIQKLTTMAGGIQAEAEEYLENIKDTANSLLELYESDSSQLRGKCQEVFTAITEGLISLLETNRENISEESQQWRQISQFVIERYEEITENSQQLIGIFERLIDR